MAVSPERGVISGMRKSVSATVKSVKSIFGSIMGEVRSMLPERAEKYEKVEEKETAKTALVGGGRRRILVPTENGVKEYALPNYRLDEKMVANAKLKTKQELFWSSVGRSTFFVKKNEPMYPNERGGQYPKSPAETKNLSDYSNFRTLVMEYISTMTDLKARPKLDAQLLRLGFFENKAGTMKAMERTGTAKFSSDEWRKANIQDETSKQRFDDIGIEGKLSLYASILEDVGEAMASRS